MSSSFRISFCGRRGRTQDVDSQNLQLCNTDLLSGSWRGFYRQKHNMVWSRDGETENPPLSIILPRLYLGAESDVTQDRLASLGISYVLSVSRCSPRPSFLPCSRHLRIPIDDSLRDDLLPWIPQALRFIDAAMSSGASVLVHCAAGISRSPALAVAYIMYSLGMDLDQAYRFVKERRPSISPNFNFLGQLQHFQGTLRQKAAGGDFLDNDLPSINHNNNHAPTMIRQSGVISSSENSCQQRRSNPDANGNQLLSLSGTLWTFNQQEVQTPFRVASPRPCVATKPTQLQLPAVSASLSERRKTLSLSLTPLGVCPATTAHHSNQAENTNVSKSVHKREPGAKTQRNSGSLKQAEESRRSKSPHTSEAKDQGLLSPLGCTLNKLLDWGERMLLGGVFAHPVKMGQPALPYRC
ncbi:protein phosphatase Slingshot homolog 1 [Dunckerocampus dactyliophorus]|uniref:protein phosphatase Slingshot homolog 1 n=1 Tax=Dunckerocampus dactyliophorus TaxID=161453 RepID=UPI002405609F|nr:protein phosphatase Slingshot homolog 1 [Dunckerocampus dactyliophorus]